MLTFNLNFTTMFHKYEQKGSAVVMCQKTNKAEKDVNF